MADDTVEAARVNLKREIAYLGGDCDDEINTLIAAVRSETLANVAGFAAAVRAEREPDAHTKRVMTEVDAAIEDEFR